jgi:hypothetical protein
VAYGVFAVLLGQIGRGHVRWRLKLLIEEFAPMPDPAENSPSREQIEARAYEIYLQRGGQDGQDIADWLAAESELTTLAEARLREATPEVAEVVEPPLAPAPRTKSTTVGQAAAAMA